MSIPITVGIAVVAGVVIGVLLLRRSAATRANGLFQAWKAEEAQSIGADAADAARLGVKASVAGPAELSSLAADGRWLGDPVHLVVFDGDAEVKAGAIDELRSITFVAVGRDRCCEADVVAECVASGRVRWHTLRLAAEEEGATRPTP